MSYSRGDLVSLPTDISTLETIYTTNEVLHVSTNDGAIVTQTGALQYMVHEFVDLVGDETIATIEIQGRSTLSPELSPVYLQVYNLNTNLWETLDTDATTEEDVDFVLSKTLRDLTNYKDGSKQITTRVYQLAI